MYKTKSRDTRFKVRDLNADEGIFTAYASVFGNVDSYGDIVVKGAFVDSLDEWSKSGSPIPLLWGHNMADPDYNIGSILSAAEDDNGLLVTASLDMGSPKAAQVFRLIKSGRVNNMSFAFDVVEGADGESEDGSYAYLLKKLRLHEVSVVPLGANQQTEILAVKSVLGSLGLQHSPDHLREVRGLLSGMVSQLDRVLMSNAEGYECLNSDAKSSAVLDVASDPLVQQFNFSNWSSGRVK